MQADEELRGAALRRKWADMGQASPRDWAWRARARCRLGRSALHWLAAAAVVFAVAACQSGIETMRSEPVSTAIAVVTLVALRVGVLLSDWIVSGGEGDA